MFEILLTLLIRNWFKEYIAAHLDASLLTLKPVEFYNNNPKFLLDIYKNFFYAGRKRI